MTLELLNRIKGISDEKLFQNWLEILHFITSKGCFAKLTGQIVKNINLKISKLTIRTWKLFLS